MKKRPQTRTPRTNAGARPPTDPAARREAIAGFYTPMAAHPSPARRVGWETAAAHTARLHAMAAALGPLEPLDSVVDAGCGEAALLPVLRAAGFAGHYRGEDILPHMVARATEACEGDADWAILCTDAFAGGPQAHAIVCSGALNTGVGEDHDAEVARALGALWERAKHVLVVDLAVRDRHPPGAGLALADLGKAWAAARRLTPSVAVREDLVPGEALLVLSRGRGRALGALLGDDAAARLVRGELLLGGGEPAAVLALLAGDDRAEALLLRGQAALAARRLDEADALLCRAAEGPAGDGARLHLAAVWWLSGRRERAEHLLRTLAQRSDDARAHLVELLVGRGDRAEAATLAASIEDPWIRREAQRVAGTPSSPGS